MEAVILAGGLGTRISSRLGALPKAMAPIGGRPFLAILLDRLVASGCSRVILSVGHLRSAILETFRNAYYGMPLEYIIEENPLGTGGAIRLALSHAHESAVLVLNGDTYVDLNYSAIATFHNVMRRPMTMAVTHVPDISRYGGVIVESDLVAAFTEKGLKGSGLINAGVYVLNRDFLWPESLPSKFSFETDVLSPFLKQIRPAAFAGSGYFLDIGVPEDLDRAQNERGRMISDKSAS